LSKIKEKGDREAVATAENLTKFLGKSPCLIISKAFHLAVTISILMLSTADF
jgi:hypothetical protein